MPIDTKYNNTQHNKNEYYSRKSSLYVPILTLDHYDKCCYRDCRNAECRGPSKVTTAKDN